jgi:Terminase small subunit
MKAKKARRPGRARAKALAVRADPIREQLFVEAYCGISNFNASDAYRRAGFTGTAASIGANAARLIGSDRVRAAIETRVAARLAELKIMDGDEALTRLSTFARADIRALFPPGHRISQLPAAVAMCIKSVTPTAHGLKFELYDAMHANELMAKVAGRLKEVLKVTFTLEQIMAAANAPPAEPPA